MTQVLTPTIYGIGSLFISYERLRARCSPLRDSRSTAANQMDQIILLFRPVGQQELDLIRELNFTAFPPRLPEQPIFYPVMNEEYAMQIAREWNAKRNDPRIGYVTRFAVRSEFLQSYDVQTVGASMHQEYWIPAEDLAEFNMNIVGVIEVVAEYRGEELLESESNVGS